MFSSPWLNPIRVFNEFKLKRISLLQLIPMSTLCLFLLLICTTLNIQKCILDLLNIHSNFDPNLTVDSIVNDETRSKNSNRLNESWIEIYGLNRTSAEIVQLPIRENIFKFGVPPAPHLQNCPLLTKEITNLENFDSVHGYPEWAIDKNEVRPPWIKGEDMDNLPFTRQVQRDIWINQHPLNCKSGVKFLITPWITSQWHGIGSQMHVMAMLFSISLASNRVFVPLPNTFERANHSNCTGSARGSLDCYFFPMVSRQCQEVARKLYEAGKFWKIEGESVDFLKEALTSQKKMLLLTYRMRHNFFHLPSFPKHMTWPKFYIPSPLKVVALKNKGGRKRKEPPWTHAFKMMEIENKTFVPEKAKYSVWMFSQVIRYMLRWPSLHLCHMLNQERHKTYGVHVVDLIQTARSEQSKIKIEPELKDLGSLDSSKWVRYQDEPSMEVWTEPYIMRPIVSLHVRQGDKGKEMKLFSFSSHMYFLEKLRFHLPDLKYVWLSTEMQAIVDESKEYPTWSFLFSELKRQEPHTIMHEYEKQVGGTKLTDLSFVNLIIASQCDYFVGTLGSNWNMLINELRLTNGRVKSNYLSLNVFSRWE